MTLEQIKNRQEHINKNLYALLEDTKIVVERIIGEQPNEPDVETKAEPYSGLLEDMELRQNTTEYLINKLNEYRQLLAYKVYAPVEPERAVVKSVY